MVKYRHYCLGERGRGGDSHLPAPKPGKRPYFSLLFSVNHQKTAAQAYYKPAKKIGHLSLVDNLVKIGLVFNWGRRGSRRGVLYVPQYDTSRSRTHSGLVNAGKQNDFIYKACPLPPPTITAAKAGSNHGGYEKEITQITPSLLR
jgi:hypothetical protein